MKRLTFITLLWILIIGTLSAQGEILFDDSYLHEIRVDLVDTTLFDDSKVYQMVKITIDGETLDSVGLKEKGNISNSVPNLRVPFKINTRKYVTGKKFDGIKEFSLNNSYGDPTMMREKLTFEICSSLGLISLRTSYAPRLYK